MLHEALFVLNISYLCYMFYYIFVCILCFLVLQYPSIFILFDFKFFVIAFCFHYIINVYMKCAKLLKCKIVIIRKYLDFDNPNFFLSYEYFCYMVFTHCSVGKFWLSMCITNVPEIQWSTCNTNGFGGN